jgi:hypothetical protein
MQEKYKKYLKLKKAIKTIRITGFLLCIFWMILIMSVFSQNIIFGMTLIAISIGALWWIVIDNKADNFEEKLIDFEEVYQIKNVKKK